jgi:hypothetical protein
MSKKSRVGLIDDEYEVLLTNLHAFLSAEPRGLDPLQRDDWWRRQDAISGEFYATSRSSPESPEKRDILTSQAKASFVVCAARFGETSRTPPTFLSVRQRERRIVRPSHPM